jgi:hypothetical protein
MNQRLISEDTFGRNKSCRVEPIGAVKLQIKIGLEIKELQKLLKRNKEK